MAEPGRSLSEIVREVEVRLGATELLRGEIERLTAIVEAEEAEALRVACEELGDARGEAAYDLVRGGENPVTPEVHDFAFELINGCPPPHRVAEAPVQSPVETPSDPVSALEPLAVADSVPRPKPKPKPERREKPSAPPADVSVRAPDPVHVDEPDFHAPDDHPPMGTSTRTLSGELRSRVIPQVLSSSDSGEEETFEMFDIEIAGSRIDEAIRIAEEAREDARKGLKKRLMQYSKKVGRNFWRQELFKIAYDHYLEVGRQGKDVSEQKPQGKTAEASPRPSRASGGKAKADGSKPDADETSEFAGPDAAQAEHEAGDAAPVVTSPAPPPAGRTAPPVRPGRAPIRPAGVAPPPPPAPRVQQAVAVAAPVAVPTAASEDDVMFGGEEGEFDVEPDGFGEMSAAAPVAVPSPPRRVEARVIEPDLEPVPETIPEPALAQPASEASAPATAQRPGRPPPPRPTTAKFRPGAGARPGMGVNVSVPAGFTLHN